VPAGLLGLLMAGLLAAFMSNFAATVNAAPPYLVNDIYKRFINPNGSAKTYMRMSYAASIAVVVAGVTFGFFIGSINGVIQWIVSSLWGGYVGANFLKWYWWRFNGYGYFWGMSSGLVGSIALPIVLPRLSPLDGFPILLGCSLVGCIAGSLLTAPTEEDALKTFYSRVRPWGFWGPVREKVMAENPAFVPNKNFGRDMFNVAVGICWQTSLVALPIYIVIRKMDGIAIALAVAVVTTIILKFSWYDKLNQLDEGAAAPTEPALAGGKA
jgi:MFS family permease